MIVRKKSVPMPAFQLGTVCPLAQKLMDAGLLLPLSEGLWRIKTREAVQEGELAHTGDYIKLDNAGMPYPTKKDWFEKNHTKVEEGLYLQVTHPRKAWHRAEPMLPEIRFLLDRGLLQWDREKGFGAQLWGTWQVAGPDAVIVLDGVTTGSQGELLSVDFHFVALDEFTVSYEVLSE